MRKFIKKIKETKETLELKLESGGNVTVFLPHIFVATARKRKGTELSLYRKNKQYPSYLLDFLDDELIAESLEGRKLKVTIELMEK